MAGTAVTVMWLLIVLLIAMVGFWVLWRMTFNVRVRLRTKTHTHDLIKDTRGKFVKDKEGKAKLIYKASFLRNETMVMPPPEAVGLTKKGKRSVEVGIGIDGARRYIVKQITGKDVSYVPFNTNDRVFLIHETEKRMMRKKKSLSEIILALAPLAALLIMFVSFLAFWGDVVKPFQDQANVQLQIQTEQKETMQIIKEIIKKEQVIAGEPVTGAVVADEVPPD